MSLGDSKNKNYDLADIPPCQNMAQGRFMVGAAHELRHVWQVQKFLTKSAFSLWATSGTKQ